MADAGLLGEIDAKVWTVDWNVNCQPAGDGLGALQSLAPYVFKVAISERRILGVDEDHVRFRYQKPQNPRVRTMTLPIMEFMRRFLQHVLPRGFMKVRYYGFLSPTFGVPLEEIKARVEMAHGFATQPVDTDICAPVPAPMGCSRCGGALKFLRVLRPTAQRPQPLPAPGPPRTPNPALSTFAAGP